MRRIARIVLFAGIGQMLVSTSVVAQSDPRTQLLRCGEESCLQVSGYRRHPGMEVLINGLVVDAEGENKWRVHLSMDAVRNMAEPRARMLTVAVRDPETRGLRVAEARLPTGLLGDVSSLGSIKVTAP